MLLKIIENMKVLFYYESIAILVNLVFFVSVLNTNKFCLFIVTYLFK